MSTNGFSTTTVHPARPASPRFAIRLTRKEGNENGKLQKLMCYIMEGIKFDYVIAKCLKLIDILRFTGNVVPCEI